jgi:hypothetical protein
MELSSASGDSIFTLATFQNCGAMSLIALLTAHGKSIPVDACIVFGSSQIIENMERKAGIGSATSSLGIRLPCGSHGFR